LSAPEQGRKLGIDVGTVRVGVAISDRDGILATPLMTLQRDMRGSADVEQVASLVTEHAVAEVVVGLPIGLSGRDGPAAQAVRAYAEGLSERIAPVPVRLVDERLTTKTAERVLAGRGVKGRARRTVVDQAAAVVILQAALDADRSARRSDE
jgi:putative Holliday junction resolvase